MPSFLDAPVDGPITQVFGGMFSGYPHRGMDFGVPEGTPVYAPDGGVVVQFTNSFTPWNGQQVRAFGRGVCLDHGDGWWSLYAHLSRIDVAIGQLIQPGDRLGLSGNTGVSTGPHLHWQLSDAPSFPVNIDQSRDPITCLISEGERMALFQRLERIEQMLGGYSGESRVQQWVANGNIPLLDCLGPQPAKLAEVTTMWDGIKDQTYGTNNLLLQWRAALAAGGIIVP